jgi:hypothetical protein
MGMTCCIDIGVVAQLKDDYIIPLHALLVEPSVGWTVENLICLIREVRINDVHSKEVLPIDRSKITQCKWAILHRGGDGSPDAEHARSNQSFEKDTELGLLTGDYLLQQTDSAIHQCLAFIREVEPNFCLA